jgi:hypothetical protein
MRVFSAFLAALALVACEKKAPPPAPSAAVDAGSPGAVASAAAPARAEKVEIPEVKIRESGPTVVKVAWSTPPGTAVNDDAPFRVRWNRSDGLAEAPSDVKATGSAVKDGFRVTVQPMTGAPNTTLGGDIDIVVCDAETHSVCVPVKRSIELGFVSAKDGPAEAEVSVPLPQAKPR